MPEKRPVTDSERLPWLGPLPDRSTAPGPRAAVRGLTLIVVLLALALAGTLSLLILRERDASTATISPVTPAAKVNLPAAPAPVPMPVQQAPVPVAEKPAATKPVQAAKSASASNRSHTRIKRAKLKRSKARRASRHKVRVHRGVRPWRGRTVQLGAFDSPRQADIAWRSAVRDYQYLGTLPKVVSPVRVGPRRHLYYRLRLAAPSPRHAVLICRAVRAMRRSCIVV